MRLTKIAAVSKKAHAHRPVNRVNPLKQSVKRLKLASGVCRNHCNGKVMQRAVMFA